MNGFENQKFCQSCAMPMADENLFGTNADGSKNEDYCIYCFKDGEFTSDMSMDEMMNFCIEKMVEVHPDIDEAQASAMMMEISFGLKEEAKAIRNAIEKVLEQGYRTPDLYNESDGQIKVGTKEITQKIIEEIEGE